MHRSCCAFLFALAGLFLSYLRVQLFFIHVTIHVNIGLIFVICFFLLHFAFEYHNTEVLLCAVCKYTVHHIVQGVFSRAFWQ